MAAKPADRKVDYLSFDPTSYRALSKLFMLTLASQTLRPQKSRFIQTRLSLMRLLLSFTLCLSFPRPIKSQISYAQL